MLLSNMCARGLASTGIVGTQAVQHGRIPFTHGWMDSNDRAGVSWLNTSEIHLLWGLVSHMHWDATLCRLLIVTLLVTPAQL